MDHTDGDWDADWSAAIGRQVRVLREAANLSAQQLSDLCGAWGYPIPRPTISKLERGGRRTVPIQEIVVLARALDVPPVRLLFDVGAGDGAIEIHPGREMLPIEAVEWFSGEHEHQMSWARSERRYHDQVLNAVRDIPELQKLVEAFEVGVYPPGEHTVEELKFLEKERRHALGQRLLAREFGLKSLGQARRQLLSYGMTPPPINGEIVDPYREQMTKLGFEAV